MIRRDLEFRDPDDAVGRYPADRLLKALFAVLVPDKPLAMTPERPDERAYNWGVDEAYRNVDGDGLLIAERCFGAVPGDGIDVHYHLTIGDAVAVHVVVGQDYSQDTLVFEIRASAEMIDVATDAMLKLAIEESLRLVRRVDASA